MVALSANELTLRLLDRGLLGGRESVVVEEVLHRNRSLIVVENPDRAFFVKQNIDGPATLGREAAIYRRGSRGTSLPFAAYLPRLRYASRRFLVLDLIAGAITLRDLASARRRVSVSAAADLGKALATVHQSDAKSLGRAERPWILDLAAPPVEILRSASGATLDLIRIVQESKRFCREVDALRREWRATALIHGDLRAENVLVRRHPGRRTKADIWIVDWELCGIGDPAWDVASVIASLLSLWVLSLPFVPGMKIDRLVHAAGLPLERVRPGIGAFWSSYASVRAFTERETRTFLQRAMRLGALRLVQHAWELSQTSPRISGEIVCALQLSLNMLKEPDRVAEDVVGEWD